MAIHRRVLLCGIALAFGLGASTATAKTFELQGASIEDIHAAVDAGKLSYEKLVQLYLARIAAYDKKGPALNTVITLNAKAIETARALDAEFRVRGRRSSLHGIPVLAKDNYDTADMPTSGGSFMLAKSLPFEDAPSIRQLRDAGAIILAKVNMDEFAHGGVGFSSRLGQTRNPHDPKRHPGGSSGGTGASVAAWFAPLGLGTDTYGSIRSPSSVNGIVGIKPTNGLISRTGIMPCLLSFDTGGPMARTVYDVALALGFMTGVDHQDPLTEASAGLSFRDYTQFLRKDALKGVRLGVIRDHMGLDAEVDRVFNAAVEELKAQGAVVVDELHYPSVALNSRADVMQPMQAELNEDYAAYLGRLRPGFPKTMAELASQGAKLTVPEGEFRPHPAMYEIFSKYSSAPVDSHSLSYIAAREHGMKAVQGAVLGLMQQHSLDALVYSTRPIPAEIINPDIARITERSTAPAIRSIANVAQFPDVIVPAGFTRDRLPVSISFVGPAYSEPRLLGYAYSYEQATHHRAAPATTPSLPGERFEY
ncbi:amidase family protein [Nevskia sp.]|uniref:amidase family protein n=1 Tax=Nevskia sp. TaxID=1929292 RepID=UPI0025F26421|nr:amidase family protein [Nevskia sp.]